MKLILTSGGLHNESLHNGDVGQVGERVYFLSVPSA